MGITIRKLTGFKPFSREAFEAHEVTEAQLNGMSRREILDMVLCYHGIIGFTGDIIGVFDDMGATIDA